MVLLSQVGPIFPLKFSHSNGTPVRPPSRPVCKAAKLMHKYQFCSFLSLVESKVLTLTLRNQTPFRLPGTERAHPFLRLESYAHSSLFSSLSPDMFAKSRRRTRLACQKMQMHSAAKAAATALDYTSTKFSFPVVAGTLPLTLPPPSHSFFSTFTEAKLSAFISE